MADTHTATVGAADFIRAVTNAALFASTDVTLPVLCTVHITSHAPGKLTFEASNRYVAGQDQVDLVDREHNTNHPGHDQCALPASDLGILVSAKEMTKLAKMIKQMINPGTRYVVAADQPKVVISFTDDASTASFILTDNLAPDSALPAEIIPGRFPDMSRFWNDHRTWPDPQSGYAAEPVPEMGAFQDWAISNAWLQMLAKVTPDGNAKGFPVRFSFGYPGKPVQVTVGDRFRAIVMSVR
jgi:hypothetical protein